MSSTRCGRRWRTPSAASSWWGWSLPWQRSPPRSSCPRDRRASWRLPRNPCRPRDPDVAGDAPLLERLAGLPPVSVAELLDLLEQLSEPGRDPMLAGLAGVDEEGEPVIHPILAVVVEHLKLKPETTCYAALLEALTGMWNAAVRGAVVARLRASGLPADDLLLRLEALSPTLG